MPVKLLPEGYIPRGPDGKGRNRLRVDAMEPNPQCALLPNDYTTMKEVHRGTIWARWGRYLPCLFVDKNCSECSIFQQKNNLDLMTDRVAVRIDQQGMPHLMNHLEKGWASFGYLKTWAWFLSLEGWEPGPLERDKHGQYFWLTKAINAET